MSVAVAEDDLVTGPEGVIELQPVMNGRHDPHPAVVEGVAAEDGGEEVERGACAVVRLVDLGVTAARFVLAGGECSGQLEGMLRVVDGASIPDCFRGERVAV